MKAAEADLGGLLTGTTRIEAPHRWSMVWTAIAAALILSGCAADAETRRAAAAKTGAPQQQPVKLRYHGGPKSPMYPG